MSDDIGAWDAVLRSSQTGQHWPTDEGDSPDRLCYECEEELGEWMELTFSYQEEVRRFCSLSCLLTWCADKVQEMEEER